MTSSEIRGQFALTASDGGGGGGGPTATIAPVAAAGAGGGGGGGGLGAGLRQPMEPLRVASDGRLS